MRKQDLADFREKLSELKRIDDLLESHAPELAKEFKSMLRSSKTPRQRAAFMRKLTKKLEAKREARER